MINIFPGAAQSDTLTMGFAFRKTDALTPVRTLLELRDAADAVAFNTLKVETNGALGIYRSTTSQLGTSAAALIAQNVWYYLELQIKLGEAPTGTVTVRRDGVDVITLTGQDTNPSGSIFVYGALRLTAGAASCTNQYDDFYLTTGPGCTFQGDHTIP